MKIIYNVIKSKYIMNHRLNHEYYSDDIVINSHIDNIISHKNYLDSILTQIKSGIFNNKLIKKLSKIAETFFNEMDNGNDENVFIPSIKTIDTSDNDSNGESDNESVCELGNISDNETYNEKLNHNNKDTKDANFIDEYEKYSQIYESNNNITIPINQSTSSQVSKSTDKLADNFLNNNLELNNFYYLKLYNIKNINNFCKDCYVY